MLNTIIFKIVLGLYFVICAPFILIGLINKRLNDFIVLKCAYGTLLLARMIVGIKYQINYPPIEENGIPVMPNGNTRLDGKAIIASKHMSIMEVAILSNYVPNSFFIVKRELLWIPIYGWAFWRMGLQPVNRRRGATNMQKLTAKVTAKIMDGKTLIIFPEGTRAKAGQPVKLKRGLLYLSHELKLPIRPVSTDTGLYWPKHGKMHSGVANIYFEPLLPCNASLDEIYEAINRHSA